MEALPSEPQPFARLPRGLAPLGYREYALYWVGFATTNIGRWAELTGLVWIVYELTNSAVLLGLIGLARATPALLLSPIAGVIADRVDRRKLLFATQGLSLLASLGLGILILTGAVELWHIYLQVVLQAAITSFDGAARQSLFPSLVPRHLLSNAVTLTITAGRFAKLVGPVAGGLLIAEFGTASPFLVNAASCLALMWAVAVMRPLRPRAVQVATFRNELVEGLRHLFNAPVLRGLFQLEIVYGLFDVNPVIIAIIAREVLGVGPRALGLLLAAPALGSFVGISWLIFLRHASRQGRFTLICTMIYACLLVFLSLSQNYLVSFLLLASVGTFDALVTVTRSSIAQLAAPEHMRGRVMANMATVTRGIGPFAETQSGFMASLLGPQIAIATAAAALATAAGLTALVNRQLWNFTWSQAAEKRVEPELSESPDP